MARKFIEGRLEQYQIEKAIELYVDEKGSLKEISEITGVTVRRIMGTLRKKNIPLRRGKEVFDKGVEPGRGGYLGFKSMVRTRRKHSDFSTVHTTRYLKDRSQIEKRFDCNGRHKNSQAGNDIYRWSKRALRMQELSERL